MKSLPIFSFLLCLLLSSCVRHKDLINFNEGAALPLDPELIANYQQVRIQPDDILYITVRSIDPEGITTRPYNPVQNTGIMGGGGANMVQLQGYLVDVNGNIQFPGMGTVEAAGLTADELRQKLVNYLQTVVKDPIVKVRFMNFRVTVLGEVGRPGMVEIPGERINVLQALGQAGDVTPLGNRENILLIREQEGTREYARINLHDREVFNSPYFYLKQNDIIYVEPNKSRAYTLADPASRILPWIGLGTTLLNLIIIISRN